MNPLDYAELHQNTPAESLSPGVLKITHSIRFVRNAGHMQHPSLRRRRLPRQVFRRFSFSFLDQPRTRSLLDAQKHVLIFDFPFFKNMQHPSLRRTIP